MKKFNIEIISKVPEKVDGIWSNWGRITIGDFSEKFVISLDNWTLEQYKQQWKEGIDRIRNHNFSCLVVTVQNLKKSPSVETWNLYKEENVIFFQNSLLIDETTEHKQIKLSDFDAHNCYQFIDYSRETITETGSKISEWSMDIKDFFHSIDKIMN